jgi:hypothetical protein
MRPKPLDGLVLLAAADDHAIPLENIGPICRCLGRLSLDLWPLWLPHSMQSLYVVQSTDIPPGETLGHRILLWWFRLWLHPVLFPLFGIVFSALAVSYDIVVAVVLFSKITNFIFFIFLINIPLEIRQTFTIAIAPNKFLFY